MPTQKPRLYLTLGDKDEAALAALVVALGLPRQKVIRKVLREAAKKLPAAE